MYILFSRLHVIFYCVVYSIKSLKNICDYDIFSRLLIIFRGILEALIRRENVFLLICLSTYFK